MSHKVRWVAVAVLLFGLSAAIAAFATRSSSTPVRETALGRLVTREVTAPPNTRVRVEILNATKTSGLARRATRVLRDRGFDVVKYASSDTMQDSTLVLDRTNHLEWAELVAKALGGAKVAARPDTSSYVDVTVVLGGNWRTPAQPFSP